MSMSRMPAPPVALAADDDSTSKRATRALECQRWTQARELLLELAYQSPHNTGYRAKLAYARGQEAAASGDESRAVAEWRRALVLDRSLVEAAQALAVRRSASWLGRLLGRT